MDKEKARKMGLAPILADPSWCDYTTIFGKIAVILEPIMPFVNPSGFLMS